MSEGKKSGRPIHTFKFPKGCGKHESVGLIEITAEEEVLAEKRGGGSKSKVVDELTKQCLAQIDGKDVSLADGSADTAWNGLTAKERNLIITAYTRLHIPNDKETEGFFASMEVQL